MSWSPGQFLVHYGDPCIFLWAGWIVFDPNKLVRCRNQFLTGGLHHETSTFSPPNMMVRLDNFTLINQIQGFTAF